MTARTGPLAPEDADTAAEGVVVPEIGITEMAEPGRDELLPRPHDTLTVPWPAPAAAAVDTEHGRTTLTVTVKVLETD